MKIESVEVLQVGCELTGQHTFVRLTTDNGVTGLGQSGGFGYPLGVAGVLDELSPCSSVPTPFGSSTFGISATECGPSDGNLFSAAVSAIDLALWDIKGKALQVPVWELLGGRTRDQVRLHALVGGGTPDEIVSSVNWAVDEGFTAVKFDPLVHGYEDFSMSQLVSSACAMAAAAREAGGDEIDLIFELHRKLDPTRAIVVCNALAQFHPLFIEDPIQIDSIETQAEICKRIDSPIATGRAAELDLGVQRASLPPRLDSRAAGRWPRWRPLGMSEDRGDRRGAPLRGRAPQLPRPRHSRLRRFTSAPPSRTS